MNEQLLRTLAIAAGPQTAADLCDALKRARVRVEEFQVLQGLRQLQKDGIVRLEGVRWRLLKMPPYVNLVPPPKPISAASPPTDVATQNAQTVFSTRSSRATVSPSASITGRWALFRRLCRYYLDCVMQEEAPQLRAYVENEDDTWIAARGIPWFRLAEGGEFAISLAREQAAFQRNRARRGEDECVYVGYPLVLVKPAQNSGFLVPLFVQPMQADWRAGVLHLQEDGPIAVNGAWLEYRFRQRVEREAFLRAMGFLSDSGDDDDEDNQAASPRDFARLAQSAAHYIHDTDRFAQDIQPLVLGVVSDWAQTNPGLYNSAIITLGPRLRYTRSLLRDLRHVAEELSDEELDRTALATLFPHDSPRCADPDSIPPAGSSEPDALDFSPHDLAQTRLLHSSQRNAVVNALSESASVVTGPPGTGKSEVVAAILLNQLLRDKATLFASKNHQALEAVLPRLNGAEGAGDLVIRSSSRELAQRQDYLAKLQSLLARPPRPDAAQGEEYRRRLLEHFKEQGAALDDISQREQARKEYETLNHRLKDLRKAMPIALQQDEALSRWPREIKREQIVSLEHELRKSLAPPVGVIQRVWHTLRRRQVESRRIAAQRPLLSLPTPSVDHSFPDADAPSDAWNDIFEAWQLWAEAAQLADAVQSVEQSLLHLQSAEACQRRLTAAQQAIEGLTREWMAWAAGGLPNPLTAVDREALANLRAGIQTWGTSRFKKELQQHFPIILRAFPLWSVSNLSARSALPLSPGLFELVIIDEASQCDIASVVPLLARSRRAVFAGDPMQLKHVSTLDVSIDQTLLEQNGLTDTQVQRFTYRMNSAFDLADANAALPEAARVRLNLHFRSHNLIADYCNEAFYAKTLHVLTASERLNVPDGAKPGIHWTHVVGTLEAGPTGARCSEEIEIVKGELVRLATSGYSGTVGVVTPFRHQMIRLKDALESCDGISRDFMERVRLVAATAHGFQGDERDLILFSLCAGPDMPDGSRIFLRENPNLFNVAVSRARAVLHIVGNREWALNCGISFVAKLAQRTLPNAKVIQTNPQELHQSPWERTLDEALQKAGIKTIPQYPVAGRFLDLAILDPRKLDVEVDGESVHRTAGGGRRDDDYWRDLQLQSLGWKVCRFWVYELREDLDRCVDRVVRLVE